MDFKKIICVAAAAAAMSCCLVGCGKDDSKDKDTGASQSQSADVTATADKLKSDISYEDDLIEIDSGKIESILGVSADAYNSAKVYISSSGATPEEIACFEAKNGSMATTIEASLTTRITNQKKTFTDYKPEQAPKLDSAVLIKDGNNVYLCISGDSSKAKEIIG
ncbi:MAG: DUF4358 domain-containing protein [Ruminococcus sp.]|nr:DUF4358 domain-containing protein [Ruminococcus sp.]